MSIMSTTRTKAAAIIAATAVLASGGAATAWAATPDAQQSTQASASSNGNQQHQHGHHKGFGNQGKDNAELASKLGVDQNTLNAALQKVRDEHKNDPKPAKDQNLTPEQHKQQEQQRREQFNKDLAAALNIDQSKVDAAMTSLQQEHQAAHSNNAAQSNQSKQAS
ncbi:hypothetical protein CFAL_10030 [Corynebacterium falsenii DSM 44353]|uniref:hypothetical protein n=1 Tax=Corynebacterium falsenii TaxID=108486 RepID=UPI0003E94A05|nr:hypothetical protein [Corynebacterium falsenii]AHI04403.1 hypothetical protein CFAL_10030 [Corynebacterium falsenii DSM 44353]UBI04649.1 hypothetical protein LA343_00170 [Corynebacterium falsenii]